MAAKTNGGKSDLMQVSSKALQEQNQRQAARRAKRDDAARVAEAHRLLMGAEESEPTFASYGFNSQEEMDAFDKNPKAGY